MKKAFYIFVPILLVIGFIFIKDKDVANNHLTETGAATVNYKEGQILAKNDNYYRKFQYKTADNFYIVQDFYTGFDTKLTDPFIITKISELAAIPVMRVTDISYYLKLTIYGPLRLWTKDGLPIEEVHFSDGNVNGVVMKWYPNGQKRSEYYYKSNVLNGLWIEWYDSGQIRIEGSYVNGERNGLWRERYASGAIALEDNYDNGILNGYHVYYDNNIKREEGNYKQGKKVGIWYFADDNIYSSKGNYLDGKKEGLWTDYYKGMRMSEGNYLNGKKNGIWTTWRSLNQKDIEVLYESGKKISEKKY